jgi:kinetochore protein Nuf2
MTEEEFSFPVLKRAEIILCLKEMGIILKPEDFDSKKGVNTATIREIYEKLVEITLYTSKAEYSQPKFSAMTAFEYPELHEESIGEIGFLKNL